MKLTTIKWITHKDKNNNLLWKMKNVKNILHLEGQEYIIKSLFNSLIASQNYFCGLDSREEVNEEDTSQSLISEPFTNSSYSRFSLNSNSFLYSVYRNKPQVRTSLVKYSNTNLQPIIFKNTFIITPPINGKEYLLSSNKLGGSKTINKGETVTFRLLFSLEL